MNLKQNKKKVMKLLEQLDWMFACQNYDRSIIFKEEDELNDRGIKLACCIEINKRYQEITIIIFPHFFEHDLLDQRKLLLHEFCHLITENMKLIAHDLLNGKLHIAAEIHEEKEKVTSQIENLLHKLLCGGMRYAKDAYKEYIK